MRCKRDTLHSAVVIFDAVPAEFVQTHSHYKWVFEDVITDRTMKTFLDLIELFKVDFFISFFFIFKDARPTNHLIKIKL